MRIALLQDDLFLPSFAGGTKANRYLLQGFADAGHQCLALTRALTCSPDGPNTPEQFDAEMDRRRIAVSENEPAVYTYRYQAVEVDAINCVTTEARCDYLIRRIDAFRPDWVFVADDKRRFMLPSASTAAPGRVIPLLQTIMQAPFGPLSVAPCQKQTALMRDAPAIIVISEYMKNYIREYGAMEPHVLHLPVYGVGPYPVSGRHESGFVTMINPCPYKGVSIFRALARVFPNVEFAAVPTWGANDDVIDDLKRLPNVRLLEPSDDIDAILSQTRILVTPSLWPESFGYVVPEAMLRGIPVLASNLGGLPEAKLGVEYLLPVTAAERHDGAYVCPPQNIEPWSNALRELIDDPAAYRSCGERSRQAAERFVSKISVAPFEQLLSELAKAQ